MGVKYTTKKDGFPEMRKRAKLIDGKSVEVGVLNGDHAWLAPIHEYGLDIEVTPAMRAYLHSQGLHLKNSTTHIHIPERSFLRTGYDENIDGILRKARLLVADYLAGKISEEALHKAVGLELSTAIKDYARDLSNPANHPYTVDQKGSSNPLVETGDMIGGITWRVANE